MSQTSSYRAYVTALKAKIDEADLQAARATISRRRRGRAVATTGKTMATLGSVAAGLLGVAVLARASKTIKK